MTDVLVHDWQGTVLTVGSRVAVGVDKTVGATVTEITDPDGDVDDDTGRSIFIAPRVHVKFDTGEDDNFATYESPRHGPDDEPTFFCDDLTGVTPWRTQVERGIADHRAHGKTPRNEPTTEAEWQALQEKFPRAIYATWFVLTGKTIGATS